MNRPFICIRDAVIFPETTLSLFVDRPQTIRALGLARAEFNDEIIILTQKKSEVEKPKSSQDVYKTGVLCKIVGMVRLQDGTIRVQVQGLKRFKLKSTNFSGAHLMAVGATSREPSKGQKLQAHKKAQMIELFVQAKPFVLFDDDSDWIHELKSAQNTRDLSRVMQRHLNYVSPSGPHKKLIRKIPKVELRSINKRNHLQQQIQRIGY
jgi:ATP-dependent Lon protease